jgi:hypothetical protein
MSHPPKDRYHGNAPSLGDCHDDAYDITPNDAADLPEIPRAVLCLTSGNLVWIPVRPGRTDAVTTPMTAGQVLKIRPRRVMAASTGTYQALC